MEDDDGGGGSGFTKIVFSLDSLAEDVGVASSSRKGSMRLHDERENAYGPQAHDE